MSIWTSLYTGASGLTAHGDGISVVGDNISNVSTVGFKSSRADFSDVIGGMAGNGQSLGQGVRMDGVETLLGQGTLQTTGRSLDFAISGKGFFVLEGSQNGIPGTYYSRDGRMQLDKDGNIVNGEGMKLQGYMIDSTGQQSASISAMKIGGVSPPRATATAAMGVNLDPSATPPAAAWDPLNPGATSNFSTSTTIYDSLGQPHRADVYFRATGTGTWDTHTMVDGGDITGGTAGTPTQIGTGTLTFNTDGTLQAQTGGTVTANFVGATAGQTIALSFGDDIASGGTGLVGSTQFAGANSVKSQSQDGYASGTLADIAVADDGTVTGRFSNGQTRSIARLALATFPSETNLQRMGNASFAVTQKSGEALVGAAGTGGSGSIASGALEQSNVDLGNELVTMIAYQRAFQANTKTVSTADEMLAEIANLKR